MKPDVLFWFYKDFETCRERVQALRMLNNDVSVFALYGGPLPDAEIAENALHGLVDDFYAYPHEKDAHWKWKHGDRLITTWFEERGQHLRWETIFIMQWDMLILAPLEKLFHGLKPGEVLLSGFRPMHSVSTWWTWADPAHPDLLAFKACLRDEYQYEGELFACLFIVACLPRIFLQNYAASACGEAGFLEYKIPTLAHIFGIPVCKNHAFDPWWAANPDTRYASWHDKTLNAVGQEIPRSAILKELADAHGKRLFHPVFRRFPAWMGTPYAATLFSVIFKALGLLRRKNS